MYSDSDLDIDQDVALATGYIHTETICPCVCVCGCTYACNICMRYMHLFNYSLLMGSSHSFPDLESTNRCKIRAWNPNASASSSPWFHGVLFTKFQALHPIPLSPAWMCIPLRQWIEFLMFKWTVTILMNHELTEVHIQVCIHIYCIYCIYIVCIYIYESDCVTIHRGLAGSTSPHRQVTRT